MKVIFTSSNLPLALAIRFMTGCKWHHCGVIYNDDLVIEAKADYKMVNPRVLIYK